MSWTLADPESLNQHFQFVCLIGLIVGSVFYPLMRIKYQFSASKCLSFTTVIAGIFALLSWNGYLLPWYKIEISQAFISLYSADSDFQFIAITDSPVATFQFDRSHCRIVIRTKKLAVNSVSIPKSECKKVAHNINQAIAEKAKP